MRRTSGVEGRLLLISIDSFSGGFAGEEGGEGDRIGVGTLARRARFFRGRFEVCGGSEASNTRLLGFDTRLRSATRLAGSLLLRRRDEC